MFSLNTDESGPYIGLVCVCMTVFAILVISNTDIISIAAISEDRTKILNFFETKGAQVDTMGSRSVVDSTTLVYYSFDDPENPGKDNSGNGHDLTMGTSPKTPRKTANTQYGRALEFDGVNDYAYCSGDGLDSATELTITTNVFINGQDRIGKPGYICSRYRWYSGSRLWIFYISINNKVGFRIWDQYENAVTIVSSIALHKWEWYTITVTFNGAKGILKMYINGKLDTTTSTSITAIHTNSYVPLRIGDNTEAGGGSNPFYGIIDEVYIYNAEKEGEGCIAFWNLNERTGTKVYDRSTFENHGTIYGATWTSDGWNDYALSFDGVNDYVHVIHNAGFENQYPYTIEFWIYYGGPGSTGGTDTILAQPGHFWIRVDRSTYKIVFESGNDPWGPDVYSQTALTLDTWTQITIIKTSSTHVKIYINGLFDAEGDTYPGTSDVSDIYIGSWSGIKHHFKGKLDDIRIYNYVKTPGCEALILPFEGSTWDGDENTGILDDKSPFDNDMSRVGVTTCSGKYGMGIYFDGDGDRVRIYPTPPSLQPTKVSVSAWIYPYEIKLSEIVDGSTGYGGYVLRLRSDGKIQFFYYKESTISVSVISSITISTYCWYHVMGTFDGRYLRVYINGICVGMLESTDPIYYSDSRYDTGFYIGAKYWGDGRYFHGIIDEVRVSNYRRTLLEDTDGDGMSDLYEIIRSTDDGADQYDPIETNMRVAFILVGYYGLDPDRYTKYLTWGSEAHNLLKSLGYSEMDIYFYVEVNDALEEPDMFDPDAVDNDAPIEADVQALFNSFKPGGSRPLDGQDTLVYFWVGDAYDLDAVIMQSTEVITSTEFNNYVDGIPFKRAIFTWPTDASGSWADDIYGQNRIILMSVDVYDSDWLWFDYALEAMQYKAGDYNGNGVISTYEFWYYAALQNYEYQGTYSQMEDNNDGICHSYYESGFDTSDPAKDGYLAYRSYI